MVIWGAIQKILDAPEEIIKVLRCLADAVSRTFDIKPKKSCGK
jgi:hypothetical protein